MYGGFAFALLPAALVSGLQLAALWFALGL